MKKLSKDQIIKNLQAKVKEQVDVIANQQRRIQQLQWSTAYMEAGGMYVAPDYGFNDAASSWCDRYEKKRGKKYYLKILSSGSPASSIRYECWAYKSRIGMFFENFVELGHFGATPEEAEKNCVESLEKLHKPYYTKTIII